MASYAATATKPGPQIVEVRVAEDTGTFFRYEATEKTIKPLYTELWYHGYMFAAFPFALAFAFGVRCIGRAMRRRVGKVIG